MSLIESSPARVAAFDTVEIPWLNGVYAPVFDERDEDDLVVTGTLPAGLVGSYLRNGPNSMFPPLGGYHLFDGDGMVHGVHFDGDGGASYRNRWIRSSGLQAEMDAGEALFGGLSDFRLPPDDVMARLGPIKNTANTALIHHAGRLFALMEGSRPTELSMDLATIGAYDYEGTLAGPMTAHPKVDPVTGELVFFGYSPLPPFLRVHSASADGVLTWSTEVELRRPVMMHDFVITPTKVVIFDLPAVFDLNSMIAGGPGIYWDGDQSARIGILERGAPGDTIRWIETDPFWVFHFLNAHEDGSAIEVVGCRAPQLNTDFSGADVEVFSPPMLWRWSIDADAGTFTEDGLDERATDFPRFDERRTGLATRYAYTGHAPDPNGSLATFDGVSKHDLQAGTVAHHVYGPAAVCGETVFAPDPAGTAEDDGWLMTFVQDADTGQSHVAVVDASTLVEVAKVHLPRRVPFGFHGAFVADAGH